MADPNMALAYSFAIGLGPSPALPNSLLDVGRRAELVDRIDDVFLVTEAHEYGLDFGQLGSAMTRLGARLCAIASTTEALIPEVTNVLERLNIVLRLWAGCLDAAKTIAHETRSGPNVPQARAGIFCMIDERAAGDAVYAAGVEAAPAFKRLRQQGYSLEGVPAQSRVRRYLV